MSASRYTAAGKSSVTIAATRIERRLTGYLIICRQNVYSHYTNIAMLHNSYLLHTFNSKLSIRNILARFDKACPI